MQIRRIVTVEDASGKSKVESVGYAPRTHDHVHIPGMSNTMLWSTPQLAALDAEATDPTISATTVLPEVGGTQLLIVAFPPDSVMMSPSFDPVLAHAENLAAVPGLAERFEAEHPGMHKTDTVDYGIVLEGNLLLELDDGATTELRRHDVVIQNGTRHAWRNPTDKVALMAFVLIGAVRR
jgi:hypothetical protein